MCFVIPWGCCRCAKIVVSLFEQFNPWGGNAAGGGNVDLGSFTGPAHKQSTPRVQAFPKKGQMSFPQNKYLCYPTLMFDPEIAHPGEVFAEDPS